MCQAFNSLPWYAVLIYLIAVHIIDAWLSKTDKVQSGSTLEIFFKLILAPMRWIFHKEE